MLWVPIVNLQTLRLRAVSRSGEIWDGHYAVCVDQRRQQRRTVTNPNIMYKLTVTIPEFILASAIDGFIYSIHQHGSVISAVSASACENLASF